MPMLLPQTDAATGGGTDGGRRPTVVPPPVAASPELSARPRRRTFTAQDKLRILAETDRAAEPVASAPSCVGRGFTRRPSATGAGSATPELSARWRPARRGPKTAEPNPLAAELAWLQQDNARLTLRLARAEAIIEHPKKSCGAAGHPAGPERRRALTDAVVALAPASGMTAAACAALGVSRASVQRRRARLAAPPAILARGRGRRGR